MWAARDSPGATSTLSQEEPGQNEPEPFPALREFSKGFSLQWAAKPSVEGPQRTQGKEEEKEEGKEEDDDALTPAAKPKLPSRIRLWKKKQQTQNTLNSW